MILLTAAQTLSVQHLLTTVADDEWIMGHQGAEWLAETPDLEDDLALSSISQDEMGQAQLLYHLVEELGGPSPDYQIYTRPVDQWHAAQFVARPRQDWAEWVVRRYFYETFDVLRRDALRSIPYPALSYALESIEREETYHWQHVQTQMQTLAFGGQESRDHLTHAIMADWPIVSSLFTWGTDDVDWRLWDVPSLVPTTLYDSFQATVRKHLTNWHIDWPANLPPLSLVGRDPRHIPEMTTICQAMQSVRQLAPESSW